ncbi:MAG: FAD-binding protein [Magnetococcales bacterium]|nr:FAD-binding protein [Magnetococcales bacterium]
MAIRGAVSRRRSPCRPIRSLCPLPSLPSSRAVSLKAVSEPDPGLTGELASALGPGGLLTGAAQREAYAWDNAGQRHLPWAVALPENREQVAAVLRVCHRAGVPVVPRGAGTGCVGGALAVSGGVILSTQRLNRILAVVPEDRLAVVEPGVVNGELDRVLQTHGLFWPPDPSSARSCTIGGNLAMCSAGPNAVRYGVTRHWVLGLTVVLPDGTPMRTGVRTTKGVVGYDLTQLLIGSEGTLAVVVEAVLRLAPRPEARRLLRACFRSMGDATQAVAGVMGSGEPPSALEFLDPAALALLRREGGVGIPEEGRALLLLEVEGSAGEVGRKAEEMLERLRPFAPLETFLAATEEETRRVWAARHALSPTLTRIAPRRINEDVVVPVSRLSELVAGLEGISAASGVPIVGFGHAGNGNIHVNLLVDPADADLMARARGALDRVFRLVLDLGGTLSGEHGVGIMKRDHIHWELDPVALELQKNIKRLFDPKGILNPGKIFGESA